MRDEGPSPEDIERFSHETAYCPECGEEIWDQTDVCPKCHAYIFGNVSSRHPLEDWFRRRWMLLVVIVALITFVLLVL